MDLNRVYDWLLAEEMKEKFCTLDEVCLFTYYISALSSYCMHELF